MFSKYLNKINMDKKKKKKLSIRSNGVFGLTGFFSFNRRDLKGDGDGHLISKKLVRIICLLGMNGCSLWNGDIDR